MDLTHETFIHADSIGDDHVATAPFDVTHARDYRLHEQLVTTQIMQGVRRIFAQDEAIVEAQQRATDDHPDHVFYKLNIDAGSMWARRIVARMLAAEQAPQAEAAE